jgi:hypothetical protein
MPILPCPKTNDPDVDQHNVDALVELITTVTPILVDGPSLDGAMAFGTALMVFSKSVQQHVSENVQAAIVSSIIETHFENQRSRLQ